jgi:hypothetical protein
LGCLASRQGLEGGQGTHSHLMQPQSSPDKGRGDRWEVSRKCFDVSNGEARSIAMQYEAGEIRTNDWMMEADSFAAGTRRLSRQCTVLRLITFCTLVHM